MVLVDLSDDQANTLQVLSTAKANVMGALEDLQGLFDQAAPSKAMQTKTYKELEDEFFDDSCVRSADSGYDTIYDNSSAASTPACKNFKPYVGPETWATGKTYADIDSTACLGDPYPMKPKRYRGPTFHPASPVIQPTLQETPQRRRVSSANLRYYQPPAACANRPHSAPKSELVVPPRTPHSQSFHQPTSQSQPGARRGLQMSELIEISDDESDARSAAVSCKAPPKADLLFDLFGFDEIVKRKVEEMKMRINRQNQERKPLIDLS